MVDSKESPAASTKVPEVVPEKPLTAQEKQNLLFVDVQQSVLLLERSVAAEETRFLTRVLRKNASLRKQLTPALLRRLVTRYVPSEHRDALLAFIPASADEAMEVEETAIVDSTSSAAPAAASVVATTTEAPAAAKTKATTKTESEAAKTEPSSEAAAAAASAAAAAAAAAVAASAAAAVEVEVYVRILLSIYLIDQKRIGDSVAACELLQQRVHSLGNRRSLQPLAARAIFYWARSHELAGTSADIRPQLLALHRTACLRRDEEAQATLINLLLRNYLAFNLYAQADKLVQRTTFNEETASSNQYARYLFYQGKIKSMKLDYTGAHRSLLLATRKAPQTGTRALGFRQAVLKLACIVQLLMGEIPDRELFRAPYFQRSLKPYLSLTEAVRIGDLPAFHAAVERDEASFQRDGTLPLIQRLRQSVIKTGLRKINISYSRISLADVCAKLHLDNIADVEFIVAKAIRDGVIDATIDHEAGFIQSKENVDIYSTEEPLAAFHQRIEFCLNLHNESVKSLRFPQKKPVVPVETEKQRREREEQLAKSLAEDEDGDDEF